MLEQLKDIFLFNQESPLIFTQFYFWGFYAVVLTVYSIIYKNKSLRNTYLYLVSLFFYYKTGGLFLFILIFSTTSDFFIGKAIYNTRTQLGKKLFVSLSVLINIGVLAFFKYDYFFTSTVNSVFGTNFEVVTHAAKWSNQLFGTHFNLMKMLPPVGISFFTFQTLSYAIDVYRGKIRPVKNLLDYGFFVSFFPQLVAGPIVRASEFIPQIYKDFSLSRRDFGMAIFIILNGLTKKLFIGDYIAVNLIDRVFSNPQSYTGFENLLALYGYSLQVYCDFSGYTDIAIGVALLMGFHLPVNFNSPYKAKNTGDFWKRWHISLSTWLKDYLYIPMGGNRNGSLFTWISLSTILIFIILIAGNLWLAPLFTIIIAGIWVLTRFFPKVKLNIITNINILLTMLLGGLWHGSSWTFVMWGGLNGLGVIVYKFWRKISPYENSTHWIANAWKIFFTFTFITFTRIWFRGETWKDTIDILQRMTNNFAGALVPEMVSNYWKVIVVMIFGMVVHWLPQSFKNKYQQWFIDTPVWMKILICAVVVFVIYQSISSKLQPFIYFQF